MAPPNKKQTDYGDFSFDSDLDFNFEGDPIPDERPKRDRKPVEHMLDGVKTGMKNTFSDPNTYKTMARDALPEGLGKAWDTVDDISYDASRLYDEALSDAKPQMASIARKLERMTPDSATKTKKYMQELSAKLTGDRKYEYDKQDREDAGVERLMAETFGKLAQQQERDREEDEAKDIVGDIIDKKRYDKNYKVFQTISSGISGVNDYLNNFQLRFQKKSLELQYRGYFALANMAKTLSEHSQISLQLQRGILKNSGLPEYAKIKEGERFKQIAKEQIFGSVQDNLFGTKDRVAAVSERIRKSIKSQVQDFREALGTVDDMLESGLSQYELDKDMAEITGEKASGYKSIGQMLGNNLAKRVHEGISNKARAAMEKNPMIMKASYGAGQFANSPGAIRDKVMRSDWFSDTRDGSAMGDVFTQMVGGMLRFLKDDDVDFKLKGTQIGQEGSDPIYSSIRQTRAQTDVVPGYLARILREVTSIRTGDNSTPLLGFDPKTGQFKSERTLAADVIASIRRDSSKSRYKDHVNSAYEVLAGDDAKNIGGADEIELKKFMAAISRKQNFVFDRDTIKRSAEYAELPPHLKEKVSKMLRNQLNPEDVDSARRGYLLSSHAKNIRGEIKDPRARISKAVADGNAAELIKMGFIKEDEDGNYDIDEKAFYKLIDDGMATSDITQKENIQHYDPKKSLQGIKNTPNFSWNYRATAGLGGGSHTGPMAQDVMRNFGNNAAPGGKKIDLVSMNGHTMAAVQALAEKVDGINMSESTEILKSIDKNIQALLAMGIQGGGGGMDSGMGMSGGKKGLLGIMSDLFGYGAEKLGHGASTALSVGRGINDKVLKPGASMIGDFVSKNKDEFKYQTVNLIQTAFDATSKAVRFTGDMLFSAAGMGKNALGTIGGFLKEKATNLFKKVSDVYVKGRESPALSAALLELGGYRDQVTGKVLKTMDDVAKIKNNIVDSAGNVVLSIQDRAKGLLDNKGKPIKSLLSDVGSFMMNRFSKGIGQAWNTGGSLLGHGRNLLGGITNRLSGMFKGRGGAEDPDSFKDKLMGALTSMKDKAGGLFSQGDSCDCWVKPLAVLEQIRDILAIGKNSKRVQAILDRKVSILSPDEVKEDNRDATQTVLLEQIRDASLIDKSKEAIAGILNTANAKLPGLGFRKEAAKRITDLKKGMVEKLSGIGGMFGGGPSSPDFMGPLQPAGMAAQGSPFPGGGLGSAFSSIGKMLPGVAGKAQQGLGWLSNRFGQRAGKGILGKGIFGRFGGLAGKGMGFLGKGLGGIAGLAGGLASAFGGNASDRPDFVGPQQPAQSGMTSGEYGDGLLSKAKDRMLKMFRNNKNGPYNDRDGDGERDGGASDRKAQLEDVRQANEQRKQAAIAASKSGIENNRYMNGPGLGGIIKAAMGLFSGLAGGVGTIFKMAKGLLGGAASLLGGGGKGLFKGLGRGAKGIGGLGKGIGKAARWGGRGLMAAGRGAMSLVGLGGAGLGALGKVGGFAQGAARAGGGLLSKIPGVASVAGRVAGFATGALRVGAVLGLATGGTMGTIAGIASTAAAGLAAALSSPVVIGAAVVAGVGAAGYFGYKYLTRNRIDDWERIRVIQYGLDGTSATETYNSQVMGLEKYLLDGNIGYQGRKPFLNEKRIKPEEIMSIFSIDPKDEERIEALSSWFGDRFKPVFLHHLAVLANIDMKANLKELNKLTNDQQLDYLSKAGFESGPYNVTASPFKGLDVLGTSIQAALDIVNAKIKTLGKAQQTKVKEAIKNGEAKPSGEDAKNAKSIVTSALNDHTAVAKAMPPAVADKYKLPEQLKNTASGVMEDSPQAGSITMDKTNDTAGSAGSSGGSKNLAMAGGPILDGSGGMKYVKLGKDAELEGMQPRLLKHFLAMAQEYGEATGKTIQVNEAFRSFQRQEQLYRTHKGKAARPGTSMHEHGLAMDIQTEQLNELEKLGLLKKYGFTRPVGGETWHMEPAGIQGSEQLAKKDKSFADMAIGSSLGRGGGGIGSIKGSALGRRDQKLARELYNAVAGQKVNLDEIGEKNPSADLKSPVVDQPGTAATQKSMDNKGDRIASQAGGRSVTQRGGSVGFSASAAAAASGGSEFEVKPPSENTGKQGEGKGDVKSQIASAALEAGGKPNELQLLSAMESGLKPNAKAGNAEGLNQFMPGAWGDMTKKTGGKYGIKPSDSRFGIRANTIMGEEYMKDNARIIAGVRPNPNFTDKYMAHYLGPYGAKKFFAADPDSPAWKINPKAANDPINKNLFFEGGEPLSIEKMYSKIENRIDQKAKAFGIPYSPEGYKGKKASDSPLQSEGNKTAPGKIDSAESFAQAPVSSKVYSKESNSGGGSTTRYATGPNGEPARSVYSPPQDDEIKMPVTSKQRQSAADITPSITKIDEPAFARIVENTSAQVTAIQSVDSTLINVIAPILRGMAENIAKGTGGEAEEKDEYNYGKPGGERVTYHAGAGGQPIRNVSSTPSSFDNSRSSNKW